VDTGAFGVASLIMQRARLQPGPERMGPDHLLRRTSSGQWMMIVPSSGPCPWCRLCCGVLLEAISPFTSPASVSGLSSGSPGGGQIYRALLLLWTCAVEGVRPGIGTLFDTRPSRSNSKWAHLTWSQARRSLQQAVGSAFDGLNKARLGPHSAP
jgi:hypothetical protein